MQVKLSLGKKTALMLVAFGILFSVVAIVGSWRTIDTMSQQQYKAQADELAATIARVVDTEDVRTIRDQVLDIYYASKNKVTSDEWGSPEFNAYIAQFSHIESTPAFTRVLEQLRSLQEVNSVDCLYMWAVDSTDELCIYLLDATLDPEEVCPPGCLDPLYDINRQVLSDPMVGFPAYITNTEEYGWLVTSAAPIVDEKGEVVAYAAVDISMHDIKAREHSFVWRLSGELLALTILLSLFVIWLVNRIVVRPINQLSRAAARYGAAENDGQPVFKPLEIHTGDEVESLYLSMVQMESDIETHIEELIETNTQLTITRLEAERMNELANKDALTGVRNRLSYDKEKLKFTQELQEGETEFGIVMVDLNDLKVINDTYGHDCGNVSLVRVSNIICDTFAHSPVFRVGGDEFVAILKGRDYAAVDELCAAFKQRVAAIAEDASLRPWERISAAIGYALYDAEIDQSVEDVFRRADQNMYEDKARMKAHQ